MKNYLLLIICFLGFSALTKAQKPADQKATKETVKLYDKLSSTIEKGIMIGHILPLAKERNKIAILSETGMESLADPNWWTGAIWPAIKEYPIAYVLFWRNAHDKPNHFYVPFPGQASEADFKDFEKIDRTLFLQDLK